MLPVKSTFQKMQRIVRDTAQILEKKVNLTVSGEETELDKTVLEHLGDPLVHIIRNAVDHGIESPEARRAAGKSETGTIFLSAYHQGGRLVIEVKDDGAGINAEVLKKKAVEKGILRPGQAISEKDALNLIFHAGFSTKAQVTEVSGRGVGMDVVRTNIEKLSGEVQISTVLGAGTTFKIFLPLTLAIIDGMVIRSATERFVIPLAQVHESLRPAKTDIQYNTGFGEVLLLRGENLPLYRLNRLLGVKSGTIREPHDGIAIVVRVSEKPFAVLVDDIIGQTQIVIKRLGMELSHIKGFSGSAILGDGRPALILELPELILKNVVTHTNPLKEGAA
jgi:two-component system chemotaxis sensor kinase CheA